MDGGLRVRKVTAATGLISGVAGSFQHGDSGDGGPATSAQFVDAKAVALDAAGNLFILDQRACRVRMVDAATQIITTVAGTGSCGYSGDGGPATLAQLNWPYGLATDAAGDIYIADTENFRIRHVSAATGIISTIAGVGSSGSGGDGGPATLAQFMRPVDVAVNAWGEVFVADASDNRIRMIVPRDLPVITWANPAAINNGTPLGAAQLNATASVPGTFVYDPPAGTVLSAGAGQILTVTFIPDDLGAYAPVLATAAIDVNAGPVTGPPYRLTIALPTGGKVQGAGINCGAGGTACTVTMPVAMSIGLAATPSAGYTFTGWTGDCSGATPAYQLALNGARTCGALFAPAGGAPAYQLTIAPVPAGGAVSGHGLACGAGGGACQVAFGAATAATLTATPSAGYEFTSWGGACSGTSLTTNVLVDAARTCTATFTAAGGGPVTGPPYTLTVTPPTGGVIRAAGIACGAGGTACAVTMPAAMSLGLEATPSAGYTFTGWTGDCSGATPAYRLALNGARTCGALFTPAGGTPAYQVTIAPVPTGGAVSGHGLACGAGGGVCQVAFGAATAATLTATPSAGYEFTGWGGACSGTSLTTGVLVDAVRTCSATFTATGGGPVTGPPYTLTVTPPMGGVIRAAGIACGAGGTACAVTMPAAMSLGLEATPSAGYTFTGWTGDCSGATPAYRLALNGARTCGALFTPAGGTPAYQVTIAPVPTGGAVSGHGLACGAGGGVCQVAFGAATAATLTATPSAGYEFTGWGGACSGTSLTTGVLLDTARTCTATFTATGGGPVTGPPYTLTVTPAAGGVIRAAGIACGAGGTACTVTMPAAMSIGLEATPSAGYTFTGWTGDCSGATPAYLLALNGARTCSAIFTPAGGGGH